MSDFDSSSPTYGFIGDVLKRVAATGLGAVFISEEGIRRAAGQFKLPKEAMATLLQQAERARSDVGRIISDEIQKALASQRFRDELNSVLSGLTIEVTAQIKLVPEGGSSLQVKPQVKSHKVAVKRTGR